MTHFILGVVVVLTVGALYRFVMAQGTTLEREHESLKRKYGGKL